MDKSKMLLALPNTGKPLALSDSTVVGKDGEFFHVAWNAKELSKPKEVPNSQTMAGYAEVGFIKFVDKPVKAEAPVEKPVVKSAKKTINKEDTK